jgi:hypothetical protein
MTTGSCLCGTVRYEISGPYQWMTHCHCSMCRKQHGALYATMLGVERRNFRWLQGEDAIVRYSSSESFERPFCRHCGSALPGTFGSFVICRAGTVDDSLEMKPIRHIFVAHKSSMCEITDSLPQFDEYAPSQAGRTPLPGPQPPTPKPGVTQGSCLCGDVVYELDETPTRLINCHCTRCRRSRGAAFGTNFFVHKDLLRWVQGAQQVRVFKLPDAQLFTTAFCEHCGSVMPSLFEKVARYIVPVGTIDTPLAAKPRVHIYVDSKAPWVDITDPLPQFAVMPPRERLKEFFWG